jgi:hypothetical protein
MAGKTFHYFLHAFAVNHADYPSYLVKGQYICERNKTFWQRKPDIKSKDSNFLESFVSGRRELNPGPLAPHGDLVEEPPRLARKAGFTMLCICSWGQNSLMVERRG